MNGTFQSKLSNSKQNKLDENEVKSTADMLAEDTEIVTKYQLDDPDVISIDELREDGFSAGNLLVEDTVSLELADSQSISGHMSDPDSDNDILANAQDMGIAIDEDEENPVELNIAADVDKAERTHWEQ